MTRKSKDLTNALDYIQIMLSQLYLFMIITKEGNTNKNQEELEIIFPLWHSELKANQLVRLQPKIIIVALVCVGPLLGPRADTGFPC